MGAVSISEYARALARVRALTDAIFAEGKLSFQTDGEPPAAAHVRFEYTDDIYSDMYHTVQELNSSDFDVLMGDLAMRCGLHLAGRDIWFAPHSSRTECRDGRFLIEIDGEVLENEEAFMAEDAC